MEKKKKTSLQLIHTILCKEHYQEEVYRKYNMGVELQDFTEINVFQENWSEVLEFYLEKFKNFTSIKAMHGAFIDLKPYSYDTLIASASMFKYRMSLNMASLLNCDYIIFHSQINPFLTNEALLKLDYETHAKLLLELLEEFHNYKGIVCIENVYEQDPHLLLRLVERIDHPRIKVNLDVGHANLSKNYSIEDWIDILHPYIGYCHFQWNNGLEDQHQSPNKKECGDLLELFEKKDLNVPLSLEYFSDKPELEYHMFEEIIGERGLLYEI